MTTPEQSEPMPHYRKMHPLAVRIMHWTNAAAMLLMITSGWKIYNDDAIFSFLRFPEEITLGYWAQHGLQWHFFAMWILALNGLVYLIYGFVSGRFRRMLLPISPRQIVREVFEALTFRLKHADLTHYNAIQKMLYAGIMVVIVIQVITGLAIWKPVQFQELVSIFSDFQGARLAHFIGMAAIVLFLVVHVSLALLVPKTIAAMITGGPKLDDSGKPEAGVPLSDTIA
jgi:thiosulfate reductase cytochrome b subunit